MNKRILFYLLLVLLGRQELSHAQMEELRLGLHWAPLPMLDFYQGGSLPLGLQYQLLPKTFVSAEGGLYLNALQFNTRDLEGYNWRLGLAYNYSSWYYLGLSYFYKDHSFNLTDEVAVNGQNLEKEYRLSKFANALSLQWGRMRWGRKKKCYLNFQMSAGLRWRQVQQVGLSSQDLDQLVSDSFIYASVRKTGLRFSPDLSMGIRIGGALWRKKFKDRL